MSEAEVKAPCSNCGREYVVCERFPCAQPKANEGFAISAWVLVGEAKKTNGTIYSLTPNIFTDEEQAQEQLKTIRASRIDFSGYDIRPCEVVPAGTLAELAELRAKQPRVWDATTIADAPEGDYDVEWYLDESQYWGGLKMPLDSVKDHFKREHISKAHGPYNIPQPTPPAPKGGQQ